MSAQSEDLIIIGDLSPFYACLMKHAMALELLMISASPIATDEMWNIGCVVHMDVSHGAFESVQLFK